VSKFVVFFTAEIFLYIGPPQVYIVTRPFLLNFPRYTVGPEKPREPQLSLAEQSIALDRENYTCVLSGTTRPPSSPVNFQRLVFILSVCRIPSTS